MTQAMPDPTSPRHQRLLIADDSAEMRLLVRDIVGANFHEVIEASNGRELFWALMRSSLQVTDEDLVIITDMYMPTYDGLQVLDAWRELHPSVATLMITAFPNDVVRQRARELGIRLLAKPFSTATLKTVVAEVAREQRAS